MIHSVTSPTFIFTLIALVVSLVIHEFAHAITADAMGDKTARHAGRITLNPVSHFEPLGLLMILFAPIGWAKPVPINPSNFRSPRAGLFLATLAGPVSNIVLALVCLFLLKWRHSGAALSYFDLTSGWDQLLVTGFSMNVNLAIFNLFPIPPLDGSRIVASVLPYNWALPYAKLELYGPFILLLIFMIPQLQQIVFNPLFGGAQNLLLRWVF